MGTIRLALAEQGTVRKLNTIVDHGTPYQLSLDGLLVPNEWTKSKIEVNGSQARLYVHEQAQPTLIVNDLKTGANTKGAIALWIDLGTVAHFRHLSVNLRPVVGQDK